MQIETGNILKLVKNGDQKAFGHLVEKYQGYAFSLAFRILCDTEESQDVVQESFIKIWKNISTYNFKLKFTTWMYKIVTNCAIDKLRTINRKKTENIDHEKTLIDETIEFNPEKHLENKEMGNLIREISNDLPEKQKLVFILRDIQGLSSEEVENILDLSQTSVKSNLYHARKIVREKLIKLNSLERRLT